MKFALITGGSRGIGKSICLKIAELGYHVIINYRSNDNEAEDTLNQVKNAGGSGELMKFDVSNPDEIRNSLNNWKEKNPDSIIEVLINNAGIRKDALIVWMKDEDWKDVLNTNLDSFYYITKHLIQDMIVNKYGRIVNVVSLSGIKGLPGQTNYSAAKGGVIAASKALAQEVAKKNVTVNCVAPGFIKTDMTKELEENELKRLIPMSRFGNAEEVADVVAFLASSKASYVTGEVISINGGLYT
ncbi:MAG TPA: 3-oxoacyl-ACP reductase FabG [Bacteroidales bacterium]|jgi:3-oxoacyl-[acyl-carrier protein] reductase|nr:3-oxoacyl-ACP reductase FabG [Bacteroidales bacterium]